MKSAVFLPLDIVDDFATILVNDCDKFENYKSLVGNEVTIFCPLHLKAAKVPSYVVRKNILLSTLS